MSVRGDRQKQQGSLLGILQGLMTPGTTLSGDAAIDRQRMLPPGRKAELLQAAGLQPQPDTQFPAAEYFTGIAGGPTQSLGGGQGSGQYLRTGSDRTPTSQIPIVQDISSTLQNIKARQAQTAANLRAIDARDSDDLGTAPTAINKQLSDIAKGLGQKRNIKPMTEAERIEMEQDEGFENIFQQPSGSTTTDGEFQSGVEGTPEFGVDNVPKDDDKTDEPYNPYGALLESAMKDVTALQGKDPNALTKEDYMKEFAEATGVNISGEPDKSHALMAFGLALMQNKAGKGFNVSKMLGAVGEAGEKAMPAFQKAKEQARAERIAAGKYALSERKAAAASRLSQLNAAQERVQDLLTRTQDYVGKQILAQQEHELDIAKVKLENIGKVKAARIKANEDRRGEEFEIQNAGTYTPLASLANIKVNTANRKIDGREVFTKPLQDVELLSKGYADTLDGISSIDRIKGLVTEVAEQSKPGGLTGQKLFEFVDNRMKALGFSDGLTVGDEGKLGPLTEATAIKDRLISQYKRFLTQETGNGISNTDIDRLAASLGNINFFTNPQEALTRLSETRKLFEMSRDTLERQLIRFGDKDNYLTPNVYDEVQQKLSSAALSGIGMGKGSLNISETDDGITVIKLS